MAKNGKINFSASTMTLKDVVIEPGSTVYNVFEGSQVTNTHDYATKVFDADNITALNPDLTHNVCNIYTPENDAKITIKNSKFDLNVANSNVLRMANYLNSTGVTIVFENIEWTYENVEYTDEDKVWAGLMLFQPAGKDNALSGNTDAISTWKVVVKNCKYNDVKVTANNFGDINQVIYGYNIGGTKAISDLSQIMTVSFE